MTDSNHSTYRRRHPVTRVIEPVVVARVSGLHRRILWRLRELSADQGRHVCLEECLRTIDYPGSKASVWHIVLKAKRLGRITKSAFDALTAALRMDDVDGWNRPWPTLPRSQDRRSLVDVITEKLMGEEPEEG